ncbi:ABC transporter ATP-binding protein [Lentilactobacillus senioris]|uniref:ABC transporter ATP-binding protein n=1 Tax=Lentilactobacillus senioris TaxID=931534 RepID=UPI0022804946|nr:ABC transporter ATP-binding protein [Lentilactobacillus senioris]MCY9806202.1 ABC transporter ATP-binding protein [Lentilactobacillus senioris]
MRRSIDFDEDSALNQSFTWVKFMALLNRSKPQIKLLVIGFLISLVSTGFSLVIPLFTKNLVNGFSLKNMNLSFIAIIIGAFLIQALTSAISSYMMGYMGEQTVSNLRELVWHKLVNLKITYFDNHQTGEITSRLVNDTTVVKSLVADQLPSFVSGILSMIGAFVVLFLMDWKLTLVILIAVPIVALLMVPIGNWMRNISIRMQRQTAEFNSTTTQALSESRLIKASDGEQTELTRGDNGIHQLFDTGVAEAKIMAIISPIMLLAMMGILVTVIGYGGVRVQNGTLSIGTLVAFLLYLFQIIAPATQFSQFFTQLQKTKGATARLDDLLEQPIEDLTVGKPVDVAGKTLTVDNVSFSYDKKNPVLQNVSFTAHPNSVVAFVGPSGSGKSTLFSLLERFYQPDNGTITIADENINTINLQSWRSQIGYVSQDSAMLVGTIRDNLTYGLTRPVSDEELWHVLSLAYADQFVRDTPEGLNTQVGERGVKVSGGQRQRLAIARAFLRDPKISMLDEATASLDSQSEEMVQRALNNLMKNRTTLVIAHRLSTIVDADNIFFLEHGEITGHGNHEELLNKHELYRQYVAEQFKQ